MSEEKPVTFSQLAEESPGRIEKVSMVATSIWGGGYDPDQVISSRDFPRRMLGDLGISS